jgi:hypothetical protein
LGRIEEKRNAGVRSVTIGRTPLKARVEHAEGDDGENAGQ